LTVPMGHLVVVVDGFVRGALLRAVTRSPSVDDRATIRSVENTTVMPGAG
jgi:hypothetical protein